MDNETMDLEQLASYLRRDVREVSKMASRGYLPGQKIGGQWRFASSEINYWIETQMSSYSEAELEALEEAGASADQPPNNPLVTALLTENTIAVPLAAGTKASVLRALVNLAETSWQVYNPDALLAAVKQREELGSTALSSGVAIPHPRRPSPTMLGDPVIAYARTLAGIPFGAPHGALSDIFFLVCCRDQRTHLKVLARISRMMLQPAVVDELRATESVAETLSILEATERELIEDK
jgi:PTS system nitrogen regulatory IIA component